MLRGVFVSGKSMVGRAVAGAWETSAVSAEAGEVAVAATSESLLAPAAQALNSAAASSSAAAANSATKPR